ncbi:MAG: hypothetical protein EOO12_05780 [Chitinophagaceae bacterium]|nr:MAG: hypothetical protein EOO12_05780 [Chitinophagaceae bacterium]
MNALLDKDDRDRKGPPLLPPFLSGCTGWALLLLVLAGSAVGFYWRQLFPAREQSVTHADTPPATGNQAHPVATVPAQSSPIKHTENDTPGSNTTDGPDAVATTPVRHSLGEGGTIRPDSRSEGGSTRLNPGPGRPIQRLKTPSKHAVTGAPTGSKTIRKSTAGAKSGNRDAATTTAAARLKKAGPAATGGAATAAGARKGAPTVQTDGPKAPKSPASAGGTSIPAAKAPPATPGAMTATGGNRPGTVASVTDSAFLATNTELKRRRYQEPGTVVPASALQRQDSAAKTAAATPAATGDSAAQAVAEVPKKKARRAPWFSAGVGISQAVPIDGQQGSGANYRGRFNPLSEHVPALWLRAHRGRWFLQGEARFNAPQLVPAFAFSQKTRWDTGAHAVQTDRQQLRKAWYHQFPLTLNYNVLPRWSIGAGAQWSVLYRAAGDRITLRRDISSTQTSESHLPFQVPGYRDSFLYRSQWQLVLQTEVGWRRWGLGLRYRSDLQPFLRYTQPDGTVSDVSNEAFEATLRFRVWQSKKRR